jgi:hypothetical protein
VNGKGFGRRLLYPNRGTIPGICLEGLPKPRKFSLCPAVLKEIRTEHLPYTSISRRPYTNLLGDACIEISSPLPQKHPSGQVSIDFTDIEDYYVSEEGVASVFRVGE